MKKGDGVKLLGILLGIVFFGGLLVLSIASTLWGFLEDSGLGSGLEVKAASTLLVVVFLSALTYLLLPRGSAKGKD